MEKEFVPYDQALKLKALGFDDPCFCWYSKEHEKCFILAPEYSNVIVKRDCISVPTFSQAFRWFREKYNLRGFIGFRPNVKQFDHHIYDMSLSGIEYTKQRTMAEYNKDPLVGTYEEAELACLDKLIEIVESKSE